MAQIRATDVIARKWALVTPQRVADYEEGIKNPVRDWSTNAKAASDSWKAGVQSAITRDAFSKGVTAAGTAKWQKGAIEKGLLRWGPGVALAEDAYATGFGPFREAIARTTLPPRFPRRDPRNLERVKAIVESLRQQKERGS